MKVSKRDTELLLVLAGLLVFLALYLFVFNIFQTKTDTVNQNIATLQPQLDELEQEYLDLAKYEQGIKDYRASVAEKLGAYPADIKEEDLMSFLLNLQATEGIKLDSVSFNGAAKLSSFPGVFAQGDKDVRTTMDAYSTSVLASGRLNYPQLKRVIDSLYAASTQTSLNSVAVSFNAETGGLTANLDISRYYVSYPEAAYAPEPLPGTSLGVADLFGTTAAAAAAAPAAPAAGKTAA